MVYLHQILIDDAAGTYVEMPYLRVAHLTGRQTHILAARLQLGIGICGPQIIHIGCGGIVDNIILL